MATPVEGSFEAFGLPFLLKSSTFQLLYYQVCTALYKEGYRAIPYGTRRDAKDRRTRGRRTENMVIS